MNSYRVEWTNLRKGTLEWEGFIDADNEDEAARYAIEKIMREDGLTIDEIEITSVKPQPPSKRRGV